MPKLIITADIHGNYNAWLTIKALLKPNDSLAVAGDLFDTRYGSYSNPAFDPETIKTELTNFHHPFYYVYGNCDTLSFFPGYRDKLNFGFSGKELFMAHGHKGAISDDPVDIVIQGHTHLAALEKKDATVFINPGSIAHSRNGLYTYGVLEKNQICLIDLKTGKSLISLDL